MDPKIRQRRIAVTRQRGRQRLRLVLVGLCAAALVVGGLLLLHTGPFSARHVTVQGARHTSASSVVKTTGLATHPPLIDVDPGRLSARLDKLPWVGTASVQRRWPDSVIIRITERVAVAAMARPAGGVAVLDASGRVLADDPRAPAGVVPLVLPENPGSPGSVLRRSALGALEVVGDLPSTVRARVQSVTEVPGGDIILGLGGGLRADLGGATQLRVKLEALESVLAGASLSGPEVIDLGVPGEPTVSQGASNGTGVVSTGRA